MRKWAISAGVVLLALGLLLAFGRPWMAQRAFDRHEPHADDETPTGDRAPPAEECGQGQDTAEKRGGKSHQGIGRHDSLPFAM